jgi:hypothetical protein
MFTVNTTISMRFEQVNKTAIVRLACIAAGLGLWYVSQRLLARRDSGTTGGGSSGGVLIDDPIHRRTAGLNRYLRYHPHRADRLLVVSSLGIDLLGIYVFVLAIVGPSFEPFIGLLILFGMRQVCQALCPLPPPPGMIWRHAGFPSLLVTYGTANDMFFSGHTSLAVFGAATLAAHAGVPGMAIGWAVAVFEISTVLVLRAHYTMDVLAGVIAALYARRLGVDIGPVVDRWIGDVVMMLGK